jgi:hypothetical protein
MIGRWALAIGIAAALLSPALAGEEGRLPDQRYVSVLPGYVYMLPLPLIEPPRPLLLPLIDFR